MALLLHRRFTFDAAHILPNHPGKCSRPHGHTYILEVSVQGSILNDDLWKEQRFFVDLGTVKSIVKAELDQRWDHFDLNQTVDDYPTAERLVHRMWEALAPRLLVEGVVLRHLRLNETPNGWVSYDGEDPIFDHRVERYDAAVESLDP